MGGSDWQVLTLCDGAATRRPALLLLWRLLHLTWTAIALHLMLLLLLLRSTSSSSLHLHLAALLHLSPSSLHLNVPLSTRLGAASSAATRLVLHLAPLHLTWHLTWHLARHLLHLVDPRHPPRTAPHVARARVRHGHPGTAAGGAPGTHRTSGATGARRPGEPHLLLLPHHRSARGDLLEALRPSRPHPCSHCEPHVLVHHHHVLVLEKGEVEYLLTTGTITGIVWWYASSCCLQIRYLPA